jgi:hypothetical protein
MWQTVLPERKMMRASPRVFHVARRKGRGKPGIFIYLFNVAKSMSECPKSIGHHFWSLGMVSADAGIRLYSTAAYSGGGCMYVL